MYNEDNAVLEKVEDPRYVPWNAQDEMRVNLLQEIFASDSVIKNILKFLTAVGAGTQTNR